MHGLHSSRMSIRVRFAPSPTGYLHVGGLRTALYNYLFARHHGGTFILRVEDTDRERLVEGATEKLLNIFPVVGLPFDEGPVLNADGTFGAKGSHGPYIQSQRLSIYKEHVDKLVAADHAYHCFCTPEELDAARKAAELMKQSTKYNRRCLGLSKEEVVARLAAGTPNVVRLHVPEGETYFTDVVRGPIRIDNAEVDDQVLLKTDGFPTYHLANVVDDHLMEITHVIRAEEWISSTPKHVILYKAFGWTAPEFAHLPLLLRPIGKERRRILGSAVFCRPYSEQRATSRVAARRSAQPPGDRLRATNVRCSRSARSCQSSRVHPPSAKNSAAAPRTNRPASTPPR